MHKLPFLDIDSTAEHPEEALKMAKATYEVLKNSIDGVSPVPWTVLEPLVRMFIAEKNPKKKEGILGNIYFVADGFGR